VRPPAHREVSHQLCPAGIQMGGMPGACLERSTGSAESICSQVCTKQLSGSPLLVSMPAVHEDGCLQQQRAQDAQPHALDVRWTCFHSSAHVLCTQRMCHRRRRTPVGLNGGRPVESCLSRAHVTCDVPSQDFSWRWAWCRDTRLEILVSRNRVTTHTHIPYSL